MAVLCSQLDVSGFNLVEHGDEEGVGREHADVHIGHAKGQCSNLLDGVRCSAALMVLCEKSEGENSEGICVGVEGK
jgi:hypothetical protein